MTQEEKARAYDEAIRKLRGMIPNWERLPYNGKTFLQDLIYIFPELKENEDEKVRKELICFLETEVVQCSARDKYIAWLEKQGKKKSQRIVSAEAKEALFDYENANIEQKDFASIEPKFKVGDKIVGIISGIPYYIKRVCYDHYETETGCLIMLCAQDNFELCKQKPAWSEEEEVKINRIVAVLGNLKVADNDILLKDIDWLKSLRPQPKQEWSDEYRNLWEWTFINLSEIKDRFGEDHNKVGECLFWLKTLRPQTTWKPSEEQIDALDEVYKTHGANSACRRVLITLLNDLKKLKG